jgi:hypothetical protein
VDAVDFALGALSLVNLLVCCCCVLLLLFSRWSTERLLLHVVLVLVVTMDWRGDTDVARDLSEDGVDFTKGDGSGESPACCLDGISWLLRLSVSVCVCVRVCEMQMTYRVLQDGNC